MLNLASLPFALLAQAAAPAAPLPESAAVGANVELAGRWVILLVAISAFAGAWVLAEWIMGMVENWKKRFLSQAETQLEDMFLAMPAARYLNLSLAAALGTGALVWLAVFFMGGGGWEAASILTFIVAVSIMLFSRMLLKILSARRLDLFNDQLEESLMGMSNSLKAGFSIMQALDMVVKQGRNPISLEFRLMMQQVQLGMTLDDALRNTAKRVKSEDFTLVASAVSTARLTGGDLTGIFDRLAEMIRERLRIQRKVKTLTAMGRLQGWVLSAVPLLLFFALYLLDSGLIKGFFSSVLGILIFSTVLLLEFCGFLVIRKIVNIDI